MRIIRAEAPRDFNLYLFGDAHEGTVAHYAKGFREMCNTIMKDPIGLAVDHGDTIEAIAIDDQRYDPVTCESRVLQQIDEAIEDRRKIAARGKLIAMVDGNHERKLWKYGEIVAHMANKLGVQYLGYTGKIQWVDPKGKLMFKHYATHGRKSINSTADDPLRQETNMKLSLKRALKKKAGDCALMTMGHTHRLMVSEPIHTLYLTDNGIDVQQNYFRTQQTAQYIHPDHRWYVNTGSFYRTQVIGADTYSEIAQYDPLELGYAVAHIRDGLLVDIETVKL